jgi:hypothetical protein
MNDVVPVEHRKQTFHGSLRVSRSRLHVFPKDAPGVLNGTQKRLLVWTIHDTA